KNVVAGIYILLEHPFKIGDRISVKDATGVVRSIELRTTILSTDDGLQMVVPNNVVLNEIVTNRSVSNLHRQVIVIQVPNASLTDTSTQISTALRDFADIAASPAPVVALESVTDGNASLRIEYWVPWGTQMALTPQVVEALQARFPNANVTVA
ncbi:MAG TPA: mechanosensitive ion channel domain-containing protein, partial [Chloroflexia bacterium]|nr:mechanosensitive ion channel domain-containing protein [Chloroflexia bacterium]